MTHTIIISNYDDIQHPVYGGGGAIAIHEVAKRLSQQMNVCVITSVYPGSIDGHIDGVRYKRIGISTGYYKIDQLLFSFILPLYAIRESFDVWIENVTPPFSFSLMPLFSRKPVIALVHMLSGMDMKRKYHLPFDHIESWGIQLYKHFIVTTESIKESILKFSQQKSVVVIPNGMTPYQSLKRKYAKTPVVVFLGRLEVNQKGLDIYLDACRIVLSQQPIKIIIAGTGSSDEVAKLTLFIQKYDLSKNVSVIGRVEGQKKKALFASASCIVVPSRFETFSMTALEALGNSIPLVTLPIYGLTWIPESCRFTASSMSSYDLSHAIIEAITRTQRQKNTVIQGKLFSKNYVWDNIADQYYRYIQSVHI